MTDPTLTTATPTELAAMVKQLGGVVLSTETVDSTVELVTRLAGETIAGTIGAGVTLVDVRGKRSTASSDVLVEQADQIQYDLDAGPCLTAWRDQTPIRVDDVTSETRWPEWTAAVALLGIRSVLSVPLTAGGTAVGAIKVYSTHPNAYDEREEQVLALFARQAAVLLVNTQTLADARQLSSDLSQALTNRDIIGQAKGVLIAQGAADEQAAFRMLVSASQRSHTKLHDVARQLVSAVADHQPLWGAPPTG